MLTTPDPARGEADHAWPEFLPDGRAVVFTIAASTGGLDAGRIAVVDVETRQVTVLPIRGTRARYVPSGHLFVRRERRAARRGVRPCATHGDGHACGRPDARSDPASSGDIQLDVAANGTLVYVPSAAAQAGPYSVVWVDRGGKETPLAGAPPRSYRQPQLSSDGARVMLSDSGQGDIWVLNLSSSALSRVTDDPASDLSSTWLSDGRVMFASNRTGFYRLYVQSADGHGEAARVIDRETTQIGPMVTPDGAGVVFTEGTAATRGGIRLLTLKTGEVTSLVDTRADERAGTVSPDGRWLAFESNRSDRFEVYVQRFPSPDAGGILPVSTGGGVQPRWGPGGKELFYVAPDGALMAITVHTRGPILVRRPRDEAVRRPLRDERRTAHLGGSSIRHPRRPAVPDAQERGISSRCVGVGRDRRGAELVRGAETTGADALKITGSAPYDPQRPGPTSWAISNPRVQAIRLRAR